MLHRGHRTWTPYVDPVPDALPLKTPIRHASQARHQTLDGKAAMMLGQQRPMTGGKRAQTVKGKEQEGKQAPMTVFKDRNLVLTGRKNGVSERGGGREMGEGDTFGIKKLDFTSGPTQPKPKSKLAHQVPLVPSPAPDDDFSALPVQTPFLAKLQARTSLGGFQGGPGGVDASTPLPSATRSRRRSSRHSGTPFRPSPPGLTSTPLPASHGASHPSASALLAPTPLDKSFITPLRPSYRAYVSPPEYEIEGEESGRDESFEMADVRVRMRALGVVDEHEGEVAVEEETGMHEVVESDGEVEYMPPKVVPLPDEIPFDFIPLKTLGEQLAQIRSDYFIACSDSDAETDEDTYTHVERRWNLDLGKHELLAGGWEGDDEVRPVAGRALKRLESRPEPEFDNPIFAALKCNQPRVTADKRPAASSAAQTRRPMTNTVGKPLRGQQAKPSSVAASGDQRPSTLVRRPVSTTAPRPRQPLTSRALPPTTVPTRRERVPVTSALNKPTPLIRPAFGNGTKQARQRSTTVRPALGQVRTNVKPTPVKEALLKCEDIGFDL